MFLEVVSVFSGQVIIRRTDFVIVQNCHFSVDYVEKPIVTVTHFCVNAAEVKRIAACLGAKLVVLAGGSSCGSSSTFGYYFTIVKIDGVLTGRILP